MRSVKKGERQGRYPKLKPIEVRVIHDSPRTVAHTSCLPFLRPFVALEESICMHAWGERCHAMCATTRGFGLDLFLATRVRESRVLRIRFLEWDTIPTTQNAKHCKTRDALVVVMPLQILSK